jgi:aspartate aminotransferase
MEQRLVSRRMQTMMAATSQVISFLTDPVWLERRKDPDVSDFLLGNPHELPLEGITAALQKWVVPQNNDWFAYKMSEENSQQVVADSLRRTHGQPFEPADISMTTGAFAGLSATLGLITDPGDEIIYISPPWFFYELMILAYDGRPVRVICDRATFDLDLQAIERAISPKTRGIIINSPNNPTGRIYPPETLRRLSELLETASRENGRTVYLLSDEAYNRIVYDGRDYPSPSSFYPHTFLIYTYGKTLLTPGQRMGYIALPPTMPERESLRLGLMTSLVASGFTFPNALLQHALQDLEKLSIDVPQLQARRDRLVQSLSRMGYEANLPEGTFYVLVRSPLENDLDFVECLAEQKILCLPGAMFDFPGYFRISLTASDAMIERALPGFQKALEASRSRQAAG